jgi:outer membrane receptor protein involved in Fe transport
VPTQPVLTCNPAENVPNGYVVNPACFAAPTAGSNGNYNMPYMKAQSYFNTDLSLFKNFDLGGEKKLQLRLNAYNAFNHPIAYPDPGTNLTLRFTNGVLSDPNFGKLPEDNKFGRRIVQLALRFTF